MASADETAALNQVVEITGANLTEAKHLLAACGNNAEAAISLYFEQSYGTDGAEVVEGGASSSRSAPVIASADDDEVRAPIAPMREQLIGPGEDNFMAADNLHSANAAPRIIRPSQRVKVCPFRDFAREAADMEEQLYERNDAPNGSIPSVGAVSTTDSSAFTFGLQRRVARAVYAAGTNVNNQDGRTTKLSSRLGDLFRPPTDIAYAGTFQAARTRAAAIKHWLLVNVQNDDFNSQLLNRDVWSNKGIREILTKNFMLWQIDADSSEGRRFITFYHCAKLPYVSVVDPRTGEEVWKSPDPNEITLLPDLQKFLTEHKDFESECDDDMPSTSKRMANVVYVEDKNDDDRQGPADTCSRAGAEKRPKIMELSEEEQIALAIKNSIQEDGLMQPSSSCTLNDDKRDNNAVKEDNESDFDSLEEFGDDDIKGACERVSYHKKLGQVTDQLTMLKIRLINAHGAEETIELRWPSDTCLETLHLYIKQQQPHVAKQNYKLICAFPRQTFTSADESRSLKELGLHPSANIHVTLDD